MNLRVSQGLSAIHQNQYHNVLTANASSVDCEIRTWIINHNVMYIHGILSAIDCIFEMILVICYLFLFLTFR